MRPTKLNRYQATYRGSDQKDQKLDLLAYTLADALMSAAELIPISATLIHVVHRPDW